MAGSSASSPASPDDAWLRLDRAVTQAPDLETLAVGALGALASLPGVRRVGLGLCEGGGRRVRFLSSDRLHDPQWCHIDAYDDVPLTEVVRTGGTIFADLAALESRFPGVVARQREESTAALAAVPLPGTGSAIGGLVLFYDEPQEFADDQGQLLLALAGRIADAVRRMRAVREPEWGDGPLPDPGDEFDVRQAGVVLDGEPRSAGVARRFLRETLAAWGVDDETSDNAQLCLSELVTNVVMHAHSGAELTVRLEREVLTVVVRDVGGPRSVAEAVAAPSRDELAVYGRGLLLVEAIADRWGSQSDASGTRAWFAHELSGARRPS